MYKNFFKRLMDILFSFIGIIILSPFYLFFSIVGFIKMKGNPFFFQLRPGKNEKIFKMLKFRSMTEEKDEEGNYLSDDTRLTNYGRWLRSTSIDETLELFNILKGDMSFVGPRPFLIKDLVFMDENIKKRHSVRPGLTGLAQVNGRNNMSWDEKFINDLKYIQDINLINDIKIVLQTAMKVFGVIRIVDEEIAITEDYGDYLLHNKRISKELYEKRLKEAEKIANDFK